LLSSSEGKQVLRFAQDDKETLEGFDNGNSNYEGAQAS